jgi:hypothetical protein
LLAIVPDDVKHLSLLLTDQFVERDARLTVVRGLNSSPRCPFACFGELMVDVLRPRDSLVGVRQAGADAQSGSAAGTAHHCPPLCGFLARAEPCDHRPVAPQHVHLARDGRVLGTHAPRLSSHCRLKEPLRDGRLERPETGG